MLIGSVGLVCFGASNEIAGAIMLFPRLSAQEYRPDAAVDAANVLITAGAEAASQVLDSFAKEEQHSNDPHRINESLCHLCHLCSLLPRLTNRCAPLG